jgi:hypothetical protein
LKSTGVKDVQVFIHFNETLLYLSLVNKYLIVIRECFLDETNSRIALRYWGLGSEEVKKIIVIFAHTQ